MARPYYREALARIHHRGFAAHPDMCAPSVLRILQPILQRQGLVLELGCGSGLNYLPDEQAIERALRAIARAVRKGGVIALDLCDLRWGQTHLDSPIQGWIGDDWALITQFSVPSPDRFVRQMAAFVKNPDGTCETMSAMTTS